MDSLISISIFWRGKQRRIEVPSGLGVSVQGELKKLKKEMERNLWKKGISVHMNPTFRDGTRVSRVVEIEVLRGS